MKFNVKLWALGLLLAGLGQPVLASSTVYTGDAKFLELSRKGRPKDVNRGGGKRTGCAQLMQGEQILTALVPTEGAGGLSATSTPTFWVYVPYVSGRPLPAVLAVRRWEGFQSQPFVKEPISLNRSGIVGLRLPQPIGAEAQASANVEPGLLEWSLTVMCDRSRPERNPFVTGLVMVKPDGDLRSRLGALPLAERVAAYGRSGYWYDALSLVAEASNSEQKTQLLNLAGLKYLSAPAPK